MSSPPTKRPKIDHLDLITASRNEETGHETTKEHSTLMKVIDGFFNILSDNNETPSTEEIKNDSVFENGVNTPISLDSQLIPEISEILSELQKVPLSSLRRILATCQLSEIMGVFDALDSDSRHYLLEAMDEQSNIKILLSDRFNNKIIFEKPERNRECVTSFLEKLQNSQESFSFCKLPKNENFSRSRDPNNSSFEQLVNCPEIGRKIAMRIVSARDEGEFTSIEDLKERVKGIGESRAVKLPEIFPSLPNRKPKRVDLTLNTLPLEDIEKLPGIGTKLAKRIEDARKDMPFKTVEDFRTRVKGVGDTIANKFFEKDL